MLNSAPAKVTRQAPRRLYDVAVQEALVVLWEASDRICGKRLKPLLPILVPALERHGHLRLDEAVRLKLFSVSAATMDRLLADARGAGSSRKRHAGHWGPEQMPPWAFLTLSHRQGHSPRLEPHQIPPADHC
jgi:hypothetical protein